MSQAIFFPGQGSQSVGMLESLISRLPPLADRLREAGEVLGLDLAKIIAEGPEESLNRTEVTQPAILTLSVGLWESLPEERRKVLAVAGHSLGEYSALVAAGSLRFSDAVALVATRGRLMQEAVVGQETAMAAILGLEDDRVSAVCAEYTGSQCVAAVNFNSPGQVVIAGHLEAVQQTSDRLREAGAKRVVPLPVSVPSHCLLMKPAAEQLAVQIDALEFQTPQIPVVQNVSAESTMDLDVLRERLVAQLYSPVLWTRSVQTLTDMGAKHFAECGPGRVLTGLMKKIDRRASVVPLSDPQSWTEEMLP